VNWTVLPARRLRGEIDVPGDKSISHRALLFSAIAEGTSVLTGLSDGEDVASTLAAIRALGVEVAVSGDEMGISGVGLRGLRAPAGPVDCGNSGTTMRLLAGLLAGQPFHSTLSGDASLCRRPMRRIVEPLRAMGARVTVAAGDTAPLRIDGEPPLRAITFQPEVASAQVKSCVLLAGLFADGPTSVIEDADTRDHSERLLGAMGADLEVVRRDPGCSVTIAPGQCLAPLSGRVPADVSSAAYWVAAAGILEGSSLTLTGIGLNPTRAAIIELLRDWGAGVEVRRTDDWCGEPVGDIVVSGTAAPLSGGAIEPAMVPGLIDELPLLAALAPLTADGVEIRGAAELRVKESDRIATTARALRALGVEVEEFPDGLAVRGGQSLGAGTVDAAGDHRIALAFGAVGLAAAGPVTIENAEAMAVSYPGFASCLQEVTER